MHIVRARRLDPLLSPAVRVLNAFRRRRSAATSTEGDLVIIKLMGLGSLAIMAPLLEHWRRTTGRRVSLVTVAVNRPFLSLLDWGVETIYLETAGPLVLLRSLVRLRRRLRQTAPGWAIDVEFYSRFTTLLTVLSGASRVAALAAPWRNRLLTDPLDWPEEVHFRDLVCGALALTGTEIPASAGCRLPLQALPPVPEDVRTERKRLVVNVNSGPLSLERRVPAATVIAALNQVNRSIPVHCDFIGAPEEREYVSAAMQGLEPTVSTCNRAGELTIPHLFGLFHACDLVVTNDSGPVHLAVGSGARLLAFYGPETPARFGPLGGDHTVLFGRIACGPCLNGLNSKQAPCRGDNVCLRQLTADDLVEPMIRMLSAATAGRNVQVDIGPRRAPPALKGVRRAR